MIKFVLTLLDLRMPELLVKHYFGCIREGVSRRQQHLRQWAEQSRWSSPRGWASSSLGRAWIEQKAEEGWLWGSLPDCLRGCSWLSGLHTQTRISTIDSSKYPLADLLGFPACRRRAAGLLSHHNHMGQYHNPPLPTAVLSTVSVTHCQLWFKSMKWKIPE